jgi:hypothetical protein
MFCKVSFEQWKSVQNITEQLKETQNSIYSQLSAQTLFLQYYALQTLVGGRIWVKVDFFFRFYVMSHVPGGKNDSRKA